MSEHATLDDRVALARRQAAEAFVIDWQVDFDTDFRRLVAEMHEAENRAIAEYAR